MTALFADVALDPAWPWSLPGLGVPALAAAGLALALLTVWTYLGVRGAGWRRVLAVLALRLLALLVACLVVLRPSFADHGTRFPPRPEGVGWRDVPCPIYTFALGSPPTTGKHQDIAVTAVHPDPPVVPVKTKLTVKTMINAPNLAGQSVMVHLLVNDKV